MAGVQNSNTKFLDDPIRSAREIRPLITLDVMDLEHVGMRGKCQRNLAFDKLAQVNQELMSVGMLDAIFMHCPFLALPGEGGRRLAARRKKLYDGPQRFVVLGFGVGKRVMACVTKGGYGLFLLTG